jgi:hypothetical protein
MTEKSSAGVFTQPRPKADSLARTLGSVPVGASLAKGHLQEIRLLTIDESRPTKDYIWLSGKGYAKIAGGSGGLYLGQYNPATIGD